MRMDTLMILNIEVSEQELERLLQAALANGFESPEAYLKWLAVAPTDEEILSDIRAAIQAIERGDPMQSLDEMWAELDADETTR